jgi:type IV pilus assembly protein PilM
MNRSKFYKFFPPPQFLQMTAVGLDISDASMRFVELVETRSGFVIGRFGDRAIPNGVIESGEVKKPADLRAVFADVKKQYNLEYVSVSLPEERAYLFELKLPLMKYADVRGAIELSLEEHVPLHAEEVLFDYEILKEKDASLHVAVSAVPRTLVDGYLEAFSGSGITPIAFEIETQSVARAVVPQGDMGSYMIVDFGNLRTGVSIVSEGAVQFTLTLSVGGVLLTEIIAKNMNIPYADAEKIKRERGILGNEEHIEHEAVSAALMAPLVTLRDEIAKDLTYWQTHDDEYGKKRPAIQKVYLCGGDSNLVGFVEYLSSGLPVPVELANVFMNANTLSNYVPSINFDESLRYATAIGLALRRPE